MAISVIIRRREGLVPTDTMQYGWVAIVNGEHILATTKLEAEEKAMEREKQLRANQR